MPFKNGDFLEVDYSAWAAADARLIATTSEKLAKEGGIYDEHVKYGPVLVVVGSNSVIKGLERVLTQMSVNDVKKMTFKPEEAFGERSADLVRVMPLADFRKRDINPYPGMQVELDNMTVVVKSVNSGRVIVDANHPYAGQDITYEIKVLKELTNHSDKVMALAKNYSVAPSSVDFKEKNITLRFNNDVKKNADYFVGKANLIASTFTYFKEVEKINVDEEYFRPKEGEKADEAEESEADGQ